MTDIPTITQEEAVEVRGERTDADLLRLIARDHERLAPNAYHSAETLRQIADRIAALSPNMDHAVGGVRAKIGTIDQYGDDAVDRLKDEAENGTMPPWVRHDLRAILPALTTPPVNQDAVREALVAAIQRADDAFGYSFNMTSLVDGVATHTLTMDGFDPVDFEDREEGYALIAERRNRMRADAILAALATPPLDNTGLDAATVERCAGECDMEEARATACIGQLAGASMAAETARTLGKTLRALASGDRS